MDFDTIRIKILTCSNETVFIKVIRIFTELYTIDNINRIASADISYHIDF